MNTALSLAFIRGASIAQTGGAILRANAQWKKMLEDYQPPPLDEALDGALLAFMAERKASFPDSKF